MTTATLPTAVLVWAGRAGLKLTGPAYPRVYGVKDFHGWKKVQPRRALSKSYAKKLRAQGVVKVALVIGALGDQPACDVEFSIKALC